MLYAILITQYVKKFLRVLFLLLYRVCIKNIGNNFFLTWLYVAARSHWAGSVVGSLTFKTRQASVACERLFRLDRIFNGPLSSDSMQAQNAANDW